MTSNEAQSTRRLLVVGVRVLGLGGRFASIPILARFLPPEEVGRYGLVVATIVYMSFALGLDFYTFATREIIGSAGSLRGRMVVSSGALYAASYAVLLPLSAGVFAAGLLPMSVLPWYLLLLPLEHLGLELERLLVANGDQVGASLVLVIRQGIWPFVIGGLLVASPPARSLTSVFAVWSVAGTAAVAIGLRRLSQTVMLNGRVDWPWMRRGLKVAIPFLIGTLLLRVLFTVDRYLVDFFDSAAAVGAYTLFIGLANGLTGILAAAVFQFTYPALVTANLNEDAAASTRIWKRALRDTLTISACYVGMLTLLGDKLLAWTGEPIYVKYEFWLPMLLIGIVIYNLSLIPHYLLYAMREDRAILAVTASATVTFCAVAWPMAKTFGLPGVVIGLSVSALVLLVGKTAVAVSKRHASVPSTIDSCIGS